MILNTKINPFALAARKNCPLILDGSMGSYLQQKDISSNDSLWMSHLNIENPDLILDIHKEYIEAGADIITTNTFRTNLYAIKQSSGKYSMKELAIAGVKIAREAAHNSDVMVAGSNAPAEDCYKIKRDISYKQLKVNHESHIELLNSLGVHLILNETISHLDEIKIICELCYRNEIPFIVSLFITNEMKILSGEHVSDIISYVNDYAPLAIGINCILPETFDKVINSVNFNYNWGFYLNCGSGNFTDKEIETGVSPDDYSRIIKKYVTKSPSFIGACCGSTPEHIRKIKETLDG